MKRLFILTLACFGLLSAQAGFNPTGGMAGGATVDAFVKDGNTVWADINGYLYKTTDNGANWTKVDFADNSSFNCLYKAGQYLMFSCGNGKVRTKRSKDGGATWEDCTTGLPNVAGFAFYVPTEVTVMNDTIFLATTTAGVWKSADYGSTWTPTAQATGCVNSVGHIGDTLVIGGVWNGPSTKPKWSTDNGKTFTDFAADLVVISGQKYNAVSSIAARNGRLFMLAAYSSSLFYTDDWGATWVKITNIPAAARVRVAGTKIYCGTAANTGGDDLYVSGDNGSTFTAEGLGKSIMTIYDDGTLVWVGTTGSGVYNASGARASWGDKNKGLYFLNATSLLQAGSNVWAVCNSRLYKSTDEGANWAQADTISGNILTADGSTLYFQAAKGVMKSTDGGATWTNMNLFSGKALYGFKADGQTMLAGIWGGSEPELHMSTDGGANWTKKSVTGTDFWWTTGTVKIQSFHKHSSTVWVAMCSKGIIVTTDGGSTWKWSNPLNNNEANLLASQGNRILWLLGSDIHMSDNNGSSWRKFRNGITGFFNPMGGLGSDGSKLMVYSVDGTNTGVYTLAATDTVWQLTASSDGLPATPKIAMLSVNGKILAAPEKNSIWMLGGSIGIASIYSDHQLSIYPNPTNGGLLNIETPSNPRRIEVLDMHGKQVLSMNVQGQRNSLDVAQLPQGMYIVKAISDDKNELVRKFIKN